MSYTGENGGYLFVDDLDPNYEAGESYNLWIRPGSAREIHLMKNSGYGWMLTRMAF